MRASTDERVVLERLRMTRVAKDLFLSDWYDTSCSTLAFSEHGCKELARVSRETDEEREHLLEIVREWAALAAPQRATEHVVDVARVARRDFLLNLIDVKDAAGESLERAALIAPLELRQRLEELAAQDFRHATDLRALLVAEVQDAWASRSRRED